MDILHLNLEKKKNEKLLKIFFLMPYCKYCGILRTNLNNCEKCRDQFCVICRHKWEWMLMTDEWDVDQCLRCMLKVPSVRPRPKCANRTHIVGMKCYYCFE